MNKTVTYKVCTMCGKEYKENYDSGSGINGTLISKSVTGGLDLNLEFQFCPNCYKACENMSIRDLIMFLKELK